MKRFLFISIAGILLIGSGGYAAHGQIFDKNDVSLQIVPEHPKAGDRVVATVSSSLFDINTATVTWLLDGKQVLQGTGAKEFNISSADAGKTTIQATIETPDWSEDLSTSFDPSLVSLAWQSDSYVPPFYRGKELFPKEGSVTFVALLFFSDSGSALGAGDKISYEWKENGIAKADQSGFGKNTFTVQSSFLNEPASVSVSAENLTTGETGYAEASVQTSPTLAVLYENHPLNGLMLNKALGKTFSLSDPELSLFAAPFSASLDTLPFFSFNWTMNGTPLSEKSRNVTLRAKEGVSGTSAVTLSLENSQKVTEDSLNSINLIYKSSGIPSFTQP